MTELSLKKSGRRLEDYYDVLNGYAETKEAAMQAFARSWHRET